MPYIHLTTSAANVERATPALIRRLTDVASSCTDKDADYIMVFISAAAGGTGGEPSPVAFVDVRGIGGLYDAVNTRIAAGVCTVIQEELGIPPDAVYLNFTSVRAYNWGWNGRTFDG